MWIGLQDLDDDDDVWTWLDGTSLTWSRWFDDDPDNWPYEDCGGLGSDGFWDFYCSPDYPFICERLLGKDNIIRK